MHTLTVEHILQMIAECDHVSQKAILRNHIRALEGKPTQCQTCVIEEEEDNGVQLQIEDSPSDE